MEKGEESKDEKPPENAVRNMLFDFASVTTAHGISRFVTSGPIYARISWFFIWLAVMIGFIYMIIQLVLLYTSRPVSTSISISFEESLTFPGVTICNLNVFPASSMKNVRVKFPNMTIINNMFKKQFASQSSLDVSDLEMDDVSSIQENTLTAINNLPIADRLKNGQEFSSLITYCRWAGFVCNKGVFLRDYWHKTWNWKYGNCFTFNGKMKNINGSSIAPLESTSPGTSGGLTLNIDINRDEYLKGIAMETGVRVIIQDQDVFAEPTEHGFSAASGYSVSVGLRKEMIKREDVSGTGSCYDTSKANTKYFQQTCIAICKAGTQKRRCNCTSLQYRTYFGSKQCESLTESSCLLEVLSNFTNKIFDCSSRCPPSCSDIAFSKTIATSKLYPEGYLEIHKTKNLTADYVEKNIINLQIHYADQTVTTISTGQYYTFDNLVSDVGGQLGLWIGVSAVTCVEFFSLIWNLLLYCICRKKEKRVQDENAPC
ncbi:acid-sensing ion channel 5-like [Rhopilema esculentum]|uniref:acid-sensing ion channel 5-like n=1 Tax=Rhopilema esculentum TaxID=499914 RepID=UPI0031D5F56E